MSDQKKSLPFADGKITKIIIKESDDLKELITLMKKNGADDPTSLLPNADRYRASITLDGTFSSFANAIRRILIEEIEVVALLVDEKNMTTDDKFIFSMNDVIIKNFSLIPIIQSGELIDKFDDYSLSLHVVNNTSEIINVKASDIKITNKAGKNIDINKLIPDPNALIMYLRPGKFVKIHDIALQKGRAHQHAAKFTLLNNVAMAPLDMKPYNQFNNTGTRSIEYDPKKFKIMFETAGNIEPDEVMDKMYEKFSADLLDIKQKIELYKEAKEPKYFTGQDFEVSVENDIHVYKFIDHYITPTSVIAMKCYLLDENVPFATSTVDRFDSQVAYIKIKHASPSVILLKSIDECLKDMQNVVSSFKKIKITDQNSQDNSQDNNQDDYNDIDLNDLN